MKFQLDFWIFLCFAVIVVPVSLVAISPEPLACLNRIVLKDECPTWDFEVCK
jgi:hypothetical protein